MNELTGLLDEALRHATFGGEGSEPLSLEQLQQASLRRQMDSSGLPVTGIWAPAQVSDESLAKLTDHLRTMLAMFVHSESDRVGVISAVSRVVEPTLKDFALTLVRGAAIIGAARTAQLLAEWADGQPLVFQVKTLLSVVPDGALTLDEGVLVHPRPTGPSMPLDELVAGLVQNYGFFEFLSCPIMSIECAIGPVFYPSGKENPSATSVRSDWARGEMPDRFLDTFCDSLSLACNGCVRHGPYWYDYGSLEEFGVGDIGWSFSLGPRLTPGPPLSQRQLELARDIHRQRLQVAGKSESLNTAITRWVKSKHPVAGLLDQFLDLRIALEALYVQDGGTEIRHRLAIRAAWYLGCDANERSEYFSIVREAYDRGSKAAHSGTVEDDEPNRTLLSKAQDACRHGILKRLNDPGEPDWSRLVLGGVD